MGPSTRPTLLGVERSTLNIHGPEVDPAMFVRQKYKSRPEDLDSLDDKEEKLLKLALGHNKAWKLEQPVEQEQSQQEKVITYGAVVLTQQEEDLLSRVR